MSRGRLGRFLRIFLLCFCVTLGSCAKSSNKSSGVIKECNLPADQSGTLSGRWPTKPVPIAIHSGSFSGGEQGEIQAAINTWNDFYGASKGFAIMSSLSESANQKPTSICTQGLIVNGQFTGSVVVYKQTNWPYNPDVIALTTVCPNPTNGNFFMAVMEINYQHFFVGGKRVPDFRSIFLHEFGHLLGLNHSCETADKSGTPNCNSGSLNSDYFEAAMFPVVFFPDNVNGEQRRDLRKNDQERANCLY